MPLHTMFGLNGVGKDTIASELREKNKNLVTTSESRMLMYLLGITDGVTTDISVGRAQYSQLESTPQEKIVELEQGGPMEELLGSIAIGKQPVLNLSHLVFATYLDGNVAYLEKSKPEWYVKSSDVFVNVVAPSEVVLQRRIGESATRERITSGEEEIMHHQALCDSEWDRMQTLGLPTTRFVVVENVDLDTAVRATEEAIYGK